MCRWGGAWVFTKRGWLPTKGAAADISAAQASAMRPPPPPVSYNDNILRAVFAYIFARAPGLARREHPPFARHWPDVRGCDHRTVLIANTRAVASPRVRPPRARTSRGRAGRWKQVRNRCHEGTDEGMRVGGVESCQLAGASAALIQSSRSLVPIPSECSFCLQCSVCTGVACGVCFDGAEDRPRMHACPYLVGVRAGAGGPLRLRLLLLLHVCWLTTVREQRSSNSRRVGLPPSFPIERLVVRYFFCPLFSPCLVPAGASSVLAWGVALRTTFCRGQDPLLHCSQFLANEITKTKAPYMW
jgi:hypothetical protein